MAKYKVPSFRLPRQGRCAQCHSTIAPGQSTWAFNHHVFDSPECVDTWNDIRSLL